MSTDYEQIESSQRQHHENLIFNARFEAADTEATFSLFALLKPNVSIDGNQYCVLYGENLQEGIAGFGDTLYKAIIDFNGAFYRSLDEVKK